MRVKFRSFELDDERFLLARSGQPLTIRPKVFDLLVHLVRYRERVVLREELVLSLWGTTAVGIGSLSGLVNELRRVLNETGHESSSIRTVHARGYQFVATLVSKDLAVPEARGLRITPQVIGGLDPQLDDAIAHVRAFLAEAAAEGPRAAVLCGRHSLRHARLIASARAEAIKAGFEVYRFSLAATDERELDHRTGFEADGTRPGESTVFVDRLFAALVESFGLDGLKSFMPARAQELFDRAQVNGSTGRSRPRDAFAARQYDERIWRGAADLLRTLAQKNPIAVLVDHYESPMKIGTPGLPALLNLLGSDPIFVLATGVGVRPRGDEEFSPDAMGSDQRIRTIGLAPLVANELNELLQSRGIEGLPARLADALMAHVRHDGTSLDPIVDWLGAENDAANRAREQALEQANCGPSRPGMRRIAPGDANSQSRASGAR